MPVYTGRYAKRVGGQQVRLLPPILQRTMSVTFITRNSDVRPIDHGDVTVFGK